MEAPQTANPLVLVESEDAAATIAVPAVFLPPIFLFLRISAIRFGGLHGASSFTEGCFTFAKWIAGGETIFLKGFQERLKGGSARHD
jgi:hypothetical protein